MKSFCLLVFSLFPISYFPVYAQVKGAPTPGSVVPTSRGSWTFQQYAYNIVKATFQPTSYETNELVSDAVILKPLKGSPIVSPMHIYSSVEVTGVLIGAKDDTVFLGNNRTATVTYHSTDEYKGFRFILKDNEKIFGAGERALPLNRRGYRFNLYNNPSYGYGMGADNLNYSVPFITSSNNYAIFFDNPSKGYLDIGKTNANVLEYGAVSGELNFYIILGRSYPEILSSYYKLTGTQPIPPRWAFGNFLSRFGYMSEGEVKGIMRQMKSNKIPYDAVIFDLFWFGDSIKGTMGNLDWVNKKAWPNPNKMISDFNKEGTKTILITEPFVVKQSLNYEESKKYHAVDSGGKPYVIEDFYFGAAGIVDIFRNDSKAWFWSKHKPQMNKGVEGWWGDLGEPEKHPSNLYHNLSDLGFKRLFRADEVHNVYGHYWTKMLFDKYAKEYPTKRLFSLNRSGFAGSQRYGIFPWTGDVSRSWNGLQAQLPILLGMSMSGVPYIHSDAGGFAGGEKDPELYVRWLQFAAFTPIFRPHGTELSKIDTTVPNYPSEPALIEEPYRTVAKQIIEARYKNLPYNYTLAYEQARYGKPLISPLYYYFSHDTTACKIEDEYMWGENILVAPVLQKGVQTRAVYFPKGQQWYDFATNVMHAGSSTFEYNVKNLAFPVFIKEGSFIPQYKTTSVNTAAIDKTSFNLFYIPSSNPSSYEMYDDDGESKNALSSGSYELISFSSRGKKGKGLAITITAKGKGFKGKPLQRSFNVIIPSITRQPAVLVNGKRIKVASVQGSEDILSSKQPAWAGGNTNMLAVPLTYKSGTLKLELAW